MLRRTKWMLLAGSVLAGSGGLSLWHSSPSRAIAQNQAGPFAPSQGESGTEGSAGPPAVVNSVTVKGGQPVRATTMPAGGMPAQPGMPGEGGMAGVAGMMPGRLMSSVVDEQDRQMERQAIELALQARMASGDERSKLRTALEQLTRQHFEYRQQRRRTELDELSKRVEQLHTALARREANAPAIIQRRVAELLDEDRDLRWETRASSQTGILMPDLRTTALPGAGLVEAPNLNQTAQPQDYRDPGAFGNASGAGPVPSRGSGSLTAPPVQPGPAAVTGSPVGLSGPPHLQPRLPGTTPPSDPYAGENPQPYQNTFQFKVGFDRTDSGLTGTGTSAAMARDAAIRNAMRKAAEARLELANKELELARNAAQRGSGEFTPIELERLKAAVVVAQSELEIVIAGGTVAPLSVTPPSPRSSAILAATLKKAEATRDAARVELYRIKRLVETGDVPQSEMDRAAARLAEAEAIVDITRIELEEVRPTQQKAPESPAPTPPAPGGTLQSK